MLRFAFRLTSSYTDASVLVQGGTKTGKNVENKSATGEVLDLKTLKQKC